MSASVQARNTETEGLCTPQIVHRRSRQRRCGHSGAQRIPCSCLAAEARCTPVPVSGCLAKSAVALYRLLMDRLFVPRNPAWRSRCADPGFLCTCGTLCRNCGPDNQGPILGWGCRRDTASRVQGNDLPVPSRICPVAGTPITGMVYCKCLQCAVPIRRMS